MSTAATLAVLIDAHAGPLVLLARSYTTSPEDAVQAAFGKLARLSAMPDDPAAWLYRVVRRGAIDAGKAESRRRKRESAVARPEAWFAPECDALDAAEAVRALRRLPDEVREVVVARLWGNLTLSQIADAFGVSVATAYRRYESAIAELRRELDPDHEGAR